jgi:LemA protein
MSAQGVFLIVLLGIFVISGVIVFNTMIGRKNMVGNAFASLDAMLKKRFDLIPNLVSACERYMTYERGILDELTTLRSRAASGRLTEADEAQIDTQVTKALKTFFAVAENYPQLRASDSFVLLERSLNEVEEQISAARRTFNAAVTSYNNACEMVPTNIAARLMGYEKKKWFEIPETEREPVKVWR